MAESDDLVAVVVDGETVQMSRDAVGKIQQGGQWTRDLTHRAENLSTRERAIAQREEAHATRENTLATRESQIGTRNEEAEAAVEEAGITTADLPSPLDDPDAYNTAVLAKIQEASNLGYARAKTEMAKQGDAIRGEAAAGDAHGERRRIDLGANTKTIDDYAKQMESDGTAMSAKQKSDIVKYMDTQLRMPSQGYGQKGASGVFVFSAEALAAADKAIRSEFWESRSFERGRAAGLGQNPDAADLSGSRLQAPTEAASTSDKVNYALSLPRDSQALENYVGNMSDADNNAFLLELQRFEQHEAQTGSLPT